MAKSLNKSKNSPGHTSLKANGAPITLSVYESMKASSDSDIKRRVKNEGQVIIHDKSTGKLIKIVAVGFDKNGDVVKTEERELSKEERDLYFASLEKKSKKEIVKASIDDKKTVVDKQSVYNVNLIKLME